MKGSPLFPDPSRGIAAVTITASSALRGLDLGLELRLDAPALLVEAPLVVDVAVLVRLLQLAQVAPELQLLAAEPGERAFLGAQRLVQGLALRVELRFRLGGELGLELPAVRGDAALEVLGVALDGLARDALGKREAVIALGAGDLLPAVDDDGARHGFLRNSGSEPETRKKRKSGSDPMVREVVAHGVSLRDREAEGWLFENLEGGATVEQFLGWFPGVARAQVDAVLEHAARSGHPA